MYITQILAIVNRTALWPQRHRVASHAVEIGADKLCDALYESKAIDTSLREVDTSGARDWVVTLDGATYLAVATSKYSSIYNLKSQIYRRSPLSGQCEIVQHVDTSSAYDWEPFVRCHLPRLG